MLKSALAKIAAAYLAPAIYKVQKNALHIQETVLQSLLKTAAHTQFGLQHDFKSIKNYEDFKTAVSIRDYEAMQADIANIADGRPDVLWPGSPLYFCKSSGTTSGTKYIPVSRAQMADMIRAARNSLMLYVHNTGRADFFNHKMIFLQGSPELELHGKIAAGRLSGIVYHHVPFYARQSRMPSYKTNCIEDWEQKVEAIAHETLRENMSLISGIPPWCVMYFEKLLELTGRQHVKDVFPDFKLFAYGGVNYEPYRTKIESLVGFAVDSVETYPASEGFIAYQDKQGETGLLLNINGGIFYEFVKADDFFKPDATRLSLNDVELHVNYALILNTNAGLWGYSIGDTVKFVSKNPYRILVTGRIKHFISAFGEHVIGEEVEYALLTAARELNVSITEFTVAPRVNTQGELPYHEWLVESSNIGHNIPALEKRTDELMQQKNIYYRDLRAGNVLQQLKIRQLPAGAFIAYMKQEGKLGGQNKVPRLMNDRKIADRLISV
jgi:hypothetical protein